jgi:hypothetical protein
MPLGTSGGSGAALATDLETHSHPKEVRSMAKKPRVGTTPAPRTRRARVPDHDQIAARAYQLFVQRGGEHGHHLEDWLVAERELRDTTTAVPGVAA